MPAIDIDSIRAALDLAGTGALVIEAVQKTGSTNRVLMEAGFGDGPAPPRLLAAVSQSAGRGRQGRGWVTEPGRSAAFSIAIERSCEGARPASGLSIVAGVALAEELNRLLEELAARGEIPDPAAPIGLKWPNDLQRSDRKLGGILVESRRAPAGHAQLERFVLGIGLNLLAPRDECGAIGQPVAGLFEGEALPVPVESIIGRATAGLVAAVGLFFREGLAPFAEGWRRFDALSGRQVVALAGGRVEAAGVARGIDAEGALVLETPAGRETVRSGEISVRVADRLRAVS